MFKYIFNKSYAEQISNIVKDIPITPFLDYNAARQMDLQAPNQGQFEVFRFYASLFLTTVIRGSKIRPSLTPGFVLALKKVLKQNVMFALWLCETFTRKEFQLEFLVNCPINDMSRFIAGLLKVAMKTLYEYEERGIRATVNKIIADKRQ